MVDTSGQAFPVPDAYSATGDYSQGREGMTLRQWYAGQALSFVAQPFGNSPQMANMRKQCAESAVAMADALLAALDAPPTEPGL